MNKSSSSDDEKPPCTEKRVKLNNHEIISEYEKRLEELKKANITLVKRLEDSDRKISFLLSENGSLKKKLDNFISNQETPIGPKEIKKECLDDKMDVDSDNPKQSGALPKKVVLYQKPTSSNNLTKAAADVNGTFKANNGMVSPPSLSGNESSKTF